MSFRNIRVERSFTVSIGELIFQIDNGVFNVIDPHRGVISTPAFVQDMEVLESFAAKAKDILEPIPGNSIVYTTEAGPQKVTLIKDEKENYMLIINDQIQFATQSEEVYHEALVCPAVACREQESKTFLILGGGDGLAAKQILKGNPEAHIVLVDFDKNITDLFTDDPIMTAFNDKSMHRCFVYNEDAFTFVENHKFSYDVIICDFPDPDKEMFNKLYSLEFYTNIRKLLNVNGSLAVQSGCLVEHSKCFLSIRNTLRAAGFHTKSYYTPSMYGELVYSVCQIEKTPQVVFAGTKREYKTLSQEFFDKAMTTFRPGSFSEEEVEVNTVDNMAAYEYRIAELKPV